MEAVTLDKTKAIIGVAGSLLSIGSITVGVWIGARGKADASEVATNRQDIAVLKSQRIDDGKKLDYAVQRLDGVANQLNRWALTGHLTFQPAPELPVKEK